MADLHVTVKPRASANVVGPYDAGVLRVCVTRPASGGDANRAVLRLVARALGIPQTRLALVAGERARHKRIEIVGIDEAELARRLASIGAD